jgi:hypothetical protein
MKWLLALLPLFSYGQTWPSKNCPDTPYVKLNDDRIYHTCNCGVVIFDSTGIVELGGTTWTRTAKKQLRRNPNRCDINFHMMVVPGYFPFSDLVCVRDGCDKSFYADKNVAKQKYYPDAFIKDHPNFDLHVKEKVWAEIRYASNGEIHIFKDSLWCTLCNKVLPWQHVREAIEAGLLLDEEDKDGWYKVNPLYSIFYKNHHD